MIIDEKIQYCKDVNSPRLIYRVNENPIKFQDNIFPKN